MYDGVIRFMRVVYDLRSECVESPVPRETLRRWEDTMQEFEAVQAEMETVYESRGGESPFFNGVFR